MKRLLFMVVLIGLVLFGSIGWTACIATSCNEMSITTDAGSGSYVAIKLKDRFNVSVSGTWVGTVSLQRSYDNATWMDVESYTANVETTVNEPESEIYYRLGMANGDFSSGTCNVRLSQ